MALVTTGLLYLKISLNTKVHSLPVRYMFLAVNIKGYWDFVQNGSMKRQTFFMLRAMVLSALYVCWWVSRTSGSLRGGMQVLKAPLSNCFINSELTLFWLILLTAVTIPLRVVYFLLSLNSCIRNSITMMLFTSRGFSFLRLQKLMYFLTALSYFSVFCL